MWSEKISDVSAFADTGKQYIHFGELKYSSISHKLFYECQLKESIYPKNVNKKGTVNIKFFVKRKIRQLFKNFFQAADNALRNFDTLKKQILLALLWKQAKALNDGAIFSICLRV